MVTWIYRLIVFSGIALLVYHYFFKALGLILFFIEIWFFIFRPVWAEFLVWKKRWPEISKKISDSPAYYVAITVLLIIFLPINVIVGGDGVLKAEKILNVVAFQPAVINKLPEKIGSHVQVGDKLIGLASPELDSKLQQSIINVENLTKQYSSAGFDISTLKNEDVMRDRLLSAMAELKGLQAEKKRLNPVATFSGVIAEVEPDLFIGENIPKGMGLVTLVGVDDWVIDAYVNEDDLTRLDLGNYGWFISEGVGLPNLRGHIVAIDHDATRLLNDGMLASTNGGRILVRQDGNKLIPESAIYKIRLKIDSNVDPLMERRIRGHIRILAWPKSIFGGFFKATLAAIIRELGF